MLNLIINPSKHYGMGIGMAGPFLCMPCYGGGGNGGRPRKYRPHVNICKEPPHPVTVFSLMFMLHRNGVWTPGTQPEHASQKEVLAAFKAEVLEPRELTEDREVWPLVEPLGVNREQADRAAREQFSGYAFYWAYNVRTFNEFDKSFVPERRFCVEPALALAIMARVSAGFYHSERSPDYGIGHLCDSGAAFSDPRLSGEPMYPLWKKMNNLGQ
jgi:hypothetical protein